MQEEKTVGFTEISFLFCLPIKAWWGSFSAKDSHLNPLALNVIASR